MWWRIYHTGNAIDQGFEKMKMKSVDLKIIGLIITIGFLISLLGGMYFEAKYRDTKQLALTLCELNNAQIETGEIMLPFFIKGVKEDHNITMPEIDWPDPFDCEDLIR